MLLVYVIGWVTAWRLLRVRLRGRARLCDWTKLLCYFGLNGRCLSKFELHIRLRLDGEKRVGHWGVMEMVAC